VILAKSFKNMKSLEHINLKDNSLGNEASEALLFLLKENTRITRCNVEHNMVKYTALVEIDTIC
jgi:Ran GTPase-activating protein (RanGAP) involved in mRNA processing and transport